MVYWRPDRLVEALELLVQRPRIAAGCTDLFATTDRPDLSIGDERPILDITGIAALRGITHDDSGLRIGAATTWSDIVRADLPPALDALKQAAREVGSIQIQNTATIAGNLCNASPAADGVPPLLVLDAKVELRTNRDRRVLPLADFIHGPRRTALQPDEMVTAILLPGAALSGRSGFAKLGARRYLVISIAMVAIRLDIDAGRLVDIAIAVGACSAVATRLPRIEAAVRAGQGVNRDEVAKALDPITDVRADANYRTDAAATLIERLLGDLQSGMERAA